MDDDKDNDATDPKLISSYTRSEAFADGVLVDVTETAREAGFVIPVALTRAAWDLCRLEPAAERAGNDGPSGTAAVLVSPRSASMCSA
jgi:hypothetical protein